MMSFLVWFLSHFGCGSVARWWSANIGGIQHLVSGGGSCSADVGHTHRVQAVRETTIHLLKNYNIGLLDLLAPLPQLGASKSQK